MVAHPAGTEVSSRCHRLTPGLTPAESYKLL